MRKIAICALLAAEPMSSVVAIFDNEPPKSRKRTELIPLKKSQKNVSSKQPIVCRSALVCSGHAMRVRKAASATKTKVYIKHRQ